MHCSTSSWFAMGIILGLLGSRVWSMSTVLENEVSKKKTVELSHYDLADRISNICIVLAIIFLSAMIARLSFSRFFDFDEFQVVYASAALVRGKALYSDQIGCHFPLVNILLSLLVKIFGFKTSTVMLIRYLMLLPLLATLFFVFKISGSIWGKNAGLLAVALTMASLVFVYKGIEIRHDTLNMTFNTVGAYWALKYLKERKSRFIWLSSLFLGLALASTQKAAIWNLGIMFGLLLYTFREIDIKQTGKALAIYAVSIMLPLLISYSYLFMTTSEHLRTVLNVSLIDAIGYFSPEKANRVYPFPYPKAHIYKGLFHDNGCFYFLAIIGICFFLVAKHKWENGNLLVVFWAGLGILFYLIIKRPFHQSLLPTLPALGILVAGVLMIFRERARFLFWPKRVFLETLLILLLLVWPSCLIAQKSFTSPSMKSQLQNIAFCVENLEPKDQVLCFSQQQIYFDPVLRMIGDECGDSIYVIDAECFEREMIRTRCKVVINDHRTRFLKKEVKEKIRDHFIYTGIGDILTPGFLLRPKSSIEKEVWVAGSYYCPTAGIKVSGERIRERLIDLDQGKYRFENPTSQPVLLVYIFNREKFLGNRAKGIAH
jgi:hypothetical protein